MTIRALHLIVGRAVIDEQFSAQLLGGERAELLSGFDLSSAERTAVLDIQAETLADFAAQLEQFVGSLQTGLSRLRLGKARESGGERALGPGGDKGAPPINYSFSS